jgi:hypothetical protein
LNFFAYMLHPITSLVGVRGYDKPLGSMLASAAQGDDVLTGPNPQLPVLLDYFFPDSVVACALVAGVIGFLVIGIRMFGLQMAKSRGRYLRLGGLAASVFCPASGFIDTSQVLITGIGILAVAIGGTALEMAFPAGNSSPKPALADRT